MFACFLFFPLLFQNNKHQFTTGMKRYIILILSFFLFSCGGNKEKDDNDAGLDANTDSIVNETGTPEDNTDSKLYVWRANPDYTKVKNTAAQASILNADSLIKGLNQHYENIYLEKIKQGGDTLYTVIKNSEYLTQRMGSTGAEIYITDVVLNLTSVPGVKYVKVDMEEGDHAGPGVWSAADFKNYKEVIQ